jgi:hypothetical protein
MKIILPLKIYVGCSLLALICDSIDFTAQIIRFGRPGDEYSDILLVASCFVFWFTDIAYFFWAYHYVN